MNKKGMSLIEMIITIMILAVAGFMIASGFMAVFRFIAKGNEVQHASDIMLSYAEKSVDSDVLDQVDSQRIDTTYTIRNDRGKSVTVTANINSLSTAIDEALTLHVLQDKEQTVVKDMLTYKQMKEKAEKLYKLTNEATSKVASGLPYAGIYKSIYKDSYSNNWDSFASELLPKALRDLAPSSKPFKIVGYFPWEHYKGVAFENGQTLIYLSQNYNASFPVVTSESIHVVYDYLEQRWYYYPNDDYELVYQGYESVEPVFLYKGNNQIITTYKLFQTYIKASNSGWYVLDEDTLFDTQNPDASWVKVE